MVRTLLLPIRVIVRGTVRELSETAELAGSSESADSSLLELVDALQLAAETLDDHRQLVDALRDGVDSLSESVDRLIDSIERLIAAVAPPAPGDGGAETGEPAGGGAETGEPAGGGAETGEPAGGGAETGERPRPVSATEHRGAVGLEANGSPL